MSEVRSLLGSQDFSGRVETDAIETALRSASMRLSAGILESHLNACIIYSYWDGESTQLGRGLSLAGGDTGVLRR